MQIWPVIAAHFNMPVGEPQQVPLQDYMRDKQPEWEAAVEKYGLSKEFEWSQLGTWTFAVSTASRAPGLTSCEHAAVRWVCGTVARED